MILIFQQIDPPKANEGINFNITGYLCMSYVLCTVLSLFVPPPLSSAREFSLLSSVKDEVRKALVLLLSSRSAISLVSRDERNRGKLLPAHSPIQLYATKEHRPLSSQEMATMAQREKTVLDMNGEL